MIVSRQYFGQGSDTVSRQVRRPKKMTFLAQDEETPSREWITITNVYRQLNATAGQASIMEWTMLSNQKGFVYMQSKLDTAKDIVIQLYKDVLKSAPDSKAVYYFERLLHNLMTADDIRQALIASKPENVAILNKVVALYNELLGRNPAEPFENDVWYKQVRDGKITLDDLRKILTNSTERIGNYLSQKYGIMTSSEFQKQWSDDLNSGKKTWDDLDNYAQALSAIGKLIRDITTAIPEIAVQDRDNYARTLLRNNLPVSMLKNLFDIYKQDREQIVNYLDLIGTSGKSMTEIQDLQNDIKYLYQSELGRTPEYAELLDATQQIATNKMNLTDLKSKIESGTEYKKLTESKTLAYSNIYGYIKQAFNETLKRNPTEAELDSWFYKIRTESRYRGIMGVRQEIDLINEELRQYPEYRQVTVTTRAGDITKIFQELLNRPPTSDELNYLLPKLETGQLTLDAIRQGILSPKPVTTIPTVAPAGAGVGWLAIAGTALLLLL